MLKVATVGVKAFSQQRWLVSVASLGPTAAARAVSPPQRAPFAAPDHQLAQAQGRTLLEKLQCRDD